MSTTPASRRDQLSATPSPFGRVRALLELIKFSHTLFALPWALAGLFLGAEGWPRPLTLMWVVAAMVGARTAAMGFNRWVDRKLDATNPRTDSRPSVTGEVSGTSMVLLIALGLALFVTAAYQLNPLCGHLSWPTAALLLGYSLCKRFTASAHIVLGMALGLSPVGACLASRGTMDLVTAAAACLGLAVLFWTAGFDIFYATQDIDHDRREGLHSIPARFGIETALRLAKLFHALVPFCLVGAGLFIDAQWPFWTGVACVGALLAYEHRLVKPDDLSRVGVAFFQVNIAIAFIMMFAVAANVILFGVGGAA